VSRAEWWPLESRLGFSFREEDEGDAGGEAMNGRYAAVAPLPASHLNPESHKFVMLNLFQHPSRIRIDRRGWRNGP
jgi:hypothetical protein